MPARGGTPPQFGRPTALSSTPRALRRPVGRRLPKCFHVQRPPLLHGHAPLGTAAVGPRPIPPLPSRGNGVRREIIKEALGLLILGHRWCRPNRRRRGHRITTPKVAASTAGRRHRPRRRCHGTCGLCSERSLVKLVIHSGEVKLLLWDGDARAGRALATAAASTAATARGAPVPVDCTAAATTAATTTAPSSHATTERAVTTITASAASPISTPSSSCHRPTRVLRGVASRAAARSAPYQGCRARCGAGRRRRGRRLSRRHWALLIVGRLLRWSPGWRLAQLPRPRLGQRGYPAVGRR